MSSALSRTCPRFISFFVILVMALSGVVLVEPAPFDILIAFFITAFVVSGRFYLPRVMQLPLGLLALFLVFNIASAVFVSDTMAMARFLMITVYMAAIFLSISCIVYTWQNGADILMAGYLASCVIIGSISLISVFFGTFTNIFFLYERLRGTFKDANVFGPFLVYGILYCISAIEGHRLIGYKAMLYLCSIVVLVSCVIFSASRGGWVNLAVALFLYLAIRLWQQLRRGVNILPVVSLLLVIGLVAGINVIVVDYAQFGELLSERAQTQAYDESRFAVQRLGLEKALENPVGQGPGQFEVELGFTAWTGSDAAHSLFVRLLFEDGFGGFLSLMVFLGLSLIRAVRLAAIPWRFSALVAVTASSLVGGMVNSAVVDTLHWRHIWIQLGIIWGLYALYKKESTLCPVVRAPADGSFVPDKPR